MFEHAVFGPFIGDWETEVYVYRPFIRWVTNVINIDNVYVSSHKNRLFLYDWLDDDKKLSINEDISRDEISQYRFIHGKITKQDYTSYFKLFKRDIKDLIGSGYINYFPINYASIFSYPIYCRLFTPIKIEKNINDNGIIDMTDEYYLYIPDNNEKFSNIDKLYKALKLKYGNKIIVCGDMKTHLLDENVAMCDDYFNNGYKNIMTYINNAKVVICPMGFWTFVSNFQNKPVFSWITSKGKTRYYNMLNGNNYHIIYTDEHRLIMSSLERFLNNGGYNANI
jgi:hypothetical protein